MKRIIIASLVFGFSSPAFAQMAAPPVDPQVAVYRQLLDNANSQLAQSVAGASGQITALQKQVADLQKQLADAKAPAKPEAPKP